MFRSAYSSLLLKYDSALFDAVDDDPPVIYTYCSRTAQDVDEASAHQTGRRDPKLQYIRWSEGAGLLMGLVTAAGMRKK